MKRNLGLSLVLLLASVNLAAQAVQPSQRQSAGSATLTQLSPSKDGQPFASVQIFPAMQAGCPVSMDARQLGTGSLIAASPSRADSSRFYQRLHLTLGGRLAGNVSAARVRVHGFTSKVQVIPADSDPSAPAQMTRTLNLRFDTAGANQAAADLIVRDFTAVRSIEIVSITYLDSSTWQSAAGACSVEPDLIMPVASR